MTTLLRDSAYLDEFSRSAARVAELAATVSPDAAVPSCPDWTMRELIAHLGGVHSWATAIVNGASGRDAVRANPSGDLATWYAEQADRLRTALTETSRDRPVWSFVGSQTVAFWIRRQAHETEMHRIDAELAAGAPAEYSAGLAADGVSEVFDVMAPRRAGKKPVAFSDSIALRATDTGDWWVVRPSDQPAYVDYDHGFDLTDGDSALSVQATASDLVLGLWGRASQASWHSRDTQRTDYFGTPLTP